MIHARQLPQARALGDSGLFVGGFQSALGLVGAGQAQADEFKFFFNYMTWPEGAIEDQARFFYSLVHSGSFLDLPCTFGRGLTALGEALNRCLSPDLLSALGRVSLFV